MSFPWTHPNSSCSSINSEVNALKRDNLAASQMQGGGFPVTTEDVLATGAIYAQPAIMWKAPDFLVAVKGLKEQASGESYTVPVEFAERGILLRLLG